MGGAQNPIVSLMPVIFIFIIFYFLLIRPQKKAQDELKKMMDNNKKSRTQINMYNDENSQM